MNGQAAGAHETDAQGFCQGHRQTRNLQGGWDATGYGSRVGINISQERTRIGHTRPAALAGLSDLSFPGW